jgi:7,8-dihydropterin-6-yl-methyl-4-(beta-D-ribofuranosyl)aminobenzene 5'-phosphate synthase
VRLTILYDNEIKREGLKAGWGFSAMVETGKAPPILFDTGADGTILRHNMSQLRIVPESIGTIVISHDHGDHVGGLEWISKLSREVEVYVPAAFWGDIPGRVTRVSSSLQIAEGVFSTGQLGGMEQSLAIETGRGVLVLVGCAHPGLAEIIDAASRFGEVYGVVGGFHAFDDFSRLGGLSLIVPCHCTLYQREIRRLFPRQCLECGAGLVLEQ